MNRDKITLTKILDEISISINIMRDTSLDDFISNEILKRAVCMTVINIWELVKSLSGEFRIEYSHIPWKTIAGFRDISAHKYQTLNMGDVYKTVT